tara:strand:+ start:90 stop:401 length:312 start_codon:yes stop_codon:yes gene_type:complete
MSSKSDKTYQVGPKDVIFNRRPKGRDAKQVWVWASQVFGAPPGWMRMIPAQTSFNGKTTKTTKWLLARDVDDEKAEIEINATAKKAASMLYDMACEIQRERSD